MLIQDRTVTFNFGVDNSPNTRLVTWYLEGTGVQADQFDSPITGSINLDESTSVSIIVKEDAELLENFRLLVKDGDINGSVVLTSDLVNVTTLEITTTTTTSTTTSTQPPLDFIGTSIAGFEDEDDVYIYQTTGILDTTKSFYTGGTINDTKGYCIISSLNVQATNLPVYLKLRKNIAAIQNQIPEVTSVEYEFYKVLDLNTDPFANSGPGYPSISFPNLDGSPTTTGWNTWMQTRIRTLSPDFSIQYDNNTRLFDIRFTQSIPGNPNGNSGHDIRQQIVVKMNSNYAFVIDCTAERLQSGSTVYYSVSAQSYSKCLENMA